MNKERLKLVRQAILDHVENFDYAIFTAGGPLEGLLSNECGTCGCVAGFTCALFRDGYGIASGMVGAESLLGLNCSQANFLFYAYESPCGTIPEIDIEDATAQDAIDRIDFLLGAES